MEKIFMSVDELLKLKKLVNMEDIILEPALYAVNGEICFDKQKIFDSLSKAKKLKQVTVLTREQVEKAAGFKDRSLSPDYELEGKDYFDISSVETYLISKNPDLDISEIKERINEALVLVQKDMRVI